MSAGRPAESGEAARLDGLLRFNARTEARYEAEHGRERGASLRHIILIGLIVYNAYILTDVLLMPDIAALSVAGRLLIFTPIALVQAWLIVRLGPTMREAMASCAATGSVVVPLWLFWLTTAPLGAHTLADPILVVVYGNLLFALRFRHALAFTATAFLCAVLALATKAGLDPDLRLALTIQFGTACAFSLYANYRMERQRCTDYLRTLAARSASEAAEEARRRYQGLSHTDALTGLPNRRAIDETAAAWCAGERAVAVMMIDVDHFKPFNDALGHPEGDACLRRVAGLLGTFAPGPEILPDILAARFGGEEFTILVRDVAEPEAVRLAASLVGAVAALGIPHPGRPDGLGFVTVSVGVALKAAGAARARDALFVQADQALYRAKRRGRNGYALAEGDGAVAAIPSMPVAVQPA